MEPKVFMTEGDGEDSYSQNSKVQKGIAEAAVFPILDEALKQVRLPTNDHEKRVIVVADLGCSSGPNTITNVFHIITRLESLYSDSKRSSKSSALEAVEFQAYFSDLPWNDFNTLFKLLSDKSVAGSRKVYVAGVPGSFYGRLFPRGSVNVFFSAFSLHYLSKVPDSVKNANSSAFNKGHLWLDGATDDTVQAYKNQSELDLKAFFQARSDELTPGGLLCFVMRVRTSQKANKKKAGEDSSQDAFICLNEAANEIFSKGLITQRQLDAFNLPKYEPLFPDLLKISESYCSSFEILAAEEIRYPLFATHALSAVNGHFDTNETVDTVIEFLKGLIGGIYEELMGKETVDVLWEHFRQIAERKYAQGFGREASFGCMAMKRKDCSL